MVRKAGDIVDGGGGDTGGYAGLFSSFSSQFSGFFSFHFIIEVYLT